MHPSAEFAASRGIARGPGHRSAQTTHPPATPVMTRGLTLLFAFATGVIILPLFASQPLVQPIAAAFGLSDAAAGLISTASQLGYTAGLLLVAPLTDLLENRRLVLATLAANVLALGTTAAAPSGTSFLAAAFLLGMSMAAIQMLVPIAAALTPESRRGEVVGTVMSGVMLGIMLSRPLASIVAEQFGWRAVYAGAAFLIALLSLLLSRYLPRRPPANPVPYVSLIASLGRLVAAEPVLRRRVLYQALLVTAFNLFWTAIASRLAAAPFGLGASAIALFALAGTAGAVIAPIAGRIADRGWGRVGTRLAQATVFGALLLAGFAGAGSRWLGFDPAQHATLALGLLAAAAVLLDTGTIGDQTIGRRAVNLLQPAARGRLNGLFSGLFFIGGALGAGLSGPAEALAGWWGVTGLGAAAALLALLIGTTERKLKG
jgi:predicted MFS family arabinose efflux permease